MKGIGSAGFLALLLHATACSSGGGSSGPRSTGGIAADFEASVTAGELPLRVSFTDLSAGMATEWEWDFGDGETSASQHPTHVYAENGLYTVRLTARNSEGEDAAEKQDLVRVKLVPEFEADATTGAEPFAVAFTDRSLGKVTAWAWDFGDGEASTEQNPVHTYRSPGTYSVEMTANGPGGPATVAKANLIVVGNAPPVAAFDASTTGGEEPLTVDFTDRSSGSVTSWSWEFGDGEVSSEASPRHVYAAGSYQARLTVSGPGGADSAQTSIVVSAAPPVAAFDARRGDGRMSSEGVAPLPMDFLDRSTGSVTSWSWDFGDGATSTSPTPAHTFAQPGDYAVELVVSGPGGTSSATATVTARPAVSDPSFELQRAGRAPGSPWARVGGDAHVVNPALRAAGSVYWIQKPSTASSERVLRRWDIAAGTDAPVVTLAHSSVSDLAVDRVRGLAFWVNSTNGSIGRVSLDGTGLDADYLSGLGTPIDLTLDTVSGELFWTDFNLGRIRKTDSRRSLPTPVDVVSGGLRPRGIAVDPVARYLYWIDDPDLVRRARLDGSDVTTLLTVPDCWDLAVDPLSGDVYVSALGQIGRVSDRGLIPLVQEFSTRYLDLGLDLAGGKLYWTATCSSFACRTPSLSRADLSGRGVETLLPQQAVTPVGMALDVPTFAAGDRAFASDGALWCEISAEGTYRSKPPLCRDFECAAGSLVTTPAHDPAGLEQGFSYPIGHSFLQLDAAFLNAEGPTGGIGWKDWMSVTVSDGTTTRSLFYRANARGTAFPLRSLKHGLAMTPRERVGFDLRGLFPSSTTDTVFQLRAMVGNDGVDENPSLGYLDNVALLRPDARPVADFDFRSDPEDPLTVVFENRSSGPITDYAWTFGDLATSEEFEPVHRYPATGTDYGVVLEVTTPGGRDATRKIVRINGPPVCNAGPAQTVLPGDTVTLDGRGSSDDDGIASYRWELGDDAGTVKRGPVVTHTYPLAPRTYTVTLAVTDTEGSTSECTTSVTVRQNEGPTCSTITRSHVTPLTNESVTFTVSASDPDGIDRYEWDFGDGTTRTTSNGSVSHAYKLATGTEPHLAGYRRVWVTVYDTLGASTSCASGSFAVDPEVSWDTVYDAIAVNTCSSCHGGTTSGSGGLFGLAAQGTAYDNLVGFDAVLNAGDCSTVDPPCPDGIKRVEPGSANDSHLYRKLRGWQCCGTQMPRPLGQNPPDYYTQQELDDLAAWINAGAPER